MTELTSWSHGYHVGIRDDWRQRLAAIARSSLAESEVSSIKAYADYLLRERWSEPTLNKAMLTTSVALWLTEGLGVILLRSVLGTGERVRNVLSKVLTEWMAPDLINVRLVSYDTPLREAIESIFYEQNQRLYAECHALMEREVGGYIELPEIREAAEISKAYHVSALNPTAGIGRYCHLYERGCERHQPNLLRRIHALSATQRKRHFGARGFDRYFWFFEGFNAYTGGDRDRGLRLLEEIVKMDGMDGPPDFPAQVAFHLVGNSCLRGRYPDVSSGLRLVQRAVEIARKQRNAGAIAQTLTTLGRTHVKLEDYEEALRVLREAVVRSRESDRSSPSFPLCELAEVALRLGEHEEARSAAKSVMDLAGSAKTKRTELDRARAVLERIR